VEGESVGSLDVGDLVVGFVDGSVVEGESVGSLDVGMLVVGWVDG
jgi:hypothetical protein